MTTSVAIRNTCTKNTVEVWRVSRGIQYDGEKPVRFDEVETYIRDLAPGEEIHEHVWKGSYVFVREKNKD